MTRMAGCLAMLLMVAVLAGCQAGEKTVWCEAQQKMVPVGTYCHSTKMILGYEGTVCCEKCNKDIPVGKYCCKCSRFMFEGTAKCPGCDAEMPKGAYCEKCKRYAGLPNMACCEKCNSPFDKSKGCCPGCAKEKK